MTTPYRDEELRERLRIGEDNGWEFKAVDFRGDRPSADQRHTWADEIVAFANASGGTLLLGVNDDGSVQGMSRPQLDAIERMVTDVCRDTISPEVRPLIYRLSLDGLAFLLVQVPVGYAQHERDGRSYERVGSSKRLMSSDERLRLAQRRGQARFRGVDEQPVPGTGFETLSERRWKRLLSADNLRDPKTGLQKLGLLTSDEHGRLRASVAGMLICAEQPHEYLPQAVISAAAYRGVDASTGQMDARTIEGPLDRQVADGVAFVVRNMRVGARKDPGRVDLPEYSVRAVFEAVVNAVAHRDYSISSSRIRMRMFSDRLEISSPGSLPNGLTIERMSDLQATRNEVLASILSRMPVGDADGSGDRQYYMDRRGDGVLIIQQETQSLTGVLPHYDLIENVELRLTLPAALPASEAYDGLVSVRMNNIPLADADVLALFPNRTWKRATTNQQGMVVLDLHAGHLPLTVYVAAPGATAHIEHNWMPITGALTIELSPLQGGGSVIFPDGSGQLPGLSGRLNPILDTIGRSYLYASNISINEGQQQPVAFRPGDETLFLVDSDGTGRLVRIAAIHGQSSLVEYQSE